MRDKSSQPSSLPVEFTRSAISFSIIRVLILATLMFLASVFAWPNKSSFSVSKNFEKPESQLKTSNSEILEEAPSEAAIVPVKNFYGKKDQRGFRPVIKHEKLRRVFVSADVLNLRATPAGKVIGQLARGEDVEILEWDDKSEFVKIRTTFDRVGFVSSNRLSLERPFGFVVAHTANYLGFSDVTLKVNQKPEDFDFSQDYHLFNELLKTIPIKPSFDFSKSNLKYVLLSNSNVIFPADGTILLDWVRSSSFRPGVFFDMLESSKNSDEPIGIRIKTRLPVRRVLANGQSISTTLESLDVSRSCSSFGVSVKTVEPLAGKLELLLIDVKKVAVVSMTTRPHKGDPNYTWGFADLNNDGFQDIAFYFGGETPMSPYRRLFVAQNVSGRWQLRWIEDRSASKTECI